MESGAAALLVLESREYRHITMHESLLLPEVRMRQRLGEAEARPFGPPLKLLS